MTKSQLFKRNTEIIIGKLGGSGTSIKDLRFSFDISMDDGREVNKGTINLYNLSDETKGLFEEKDTSIIIKIGYGEENLGVFYIGDVIEYEEIYNGHDSIIKVVCGDGFIPLSERRLSLSFASGSDTKQIIDVITSQLNIIKGDYSNVPNYVYKQGFAFAGSVGTALDIILARVGYEWTISNNVLVISKHNETNEKTFVQLLTKETGLLGRPSRLKDVKIKTKVENDELIDGWKINSLILPSIKPKSLIKVQSGDVNGIFMIKAVKFTGDTHDNNWSAEMNCLKK